ncbi:hypothetical protein SUGI_0064060 [Cryptomeria japonica]|nr:hypothetical protein SUGI_0064060 [Cryptomeria japonica]
MTEYHTLHQGSMMVNEYKAKFMSLLRHVHYLKEEEDRVNKFIPRLNRNLMYTTKLARPKNLGQAVEIASVAEEKRQERKQNSSTFTYSYKKGYTKSLGVEKNPRMFKRNHREQRNFRAASDKKFEREHSKSSQTKAPNDTYKDQGRRKMEYKEVCWLCGGNHFKRDCPKWTDRSTKMHAKIHAAMDKQEVDNQASLIEIPGTFRGQPVTILSDLGATNSFIYPDVLSRYHVNSTCLS